MDRAPLYKRPPRPLVRRRSSRPKAITAALFEGFPASGVAEVCCCSVQTAYHWKAGIRRPSERELKLWKLYRDERVLTEQFRGFRVRGSELIDPKGKSLTVAQLEFYQQMLAYSRDLARRLGDAEYDRWWEVVESLSGAA